MLVHQFLEESASCYPNKIAVIHDEERITYRCLNHKANRLAQYLVDNGIRKGDRVAILLENSVNYVIVYYAILKVGAVAAPLNPGIKPNGLTFLIKDLEPAAVITSHKSERLLKAVSIEAFNIKLLSIFKPKQQWKDTPFAVSALEDAFDSGFKKENTLNAGIISTDLSSIIYTSGSTGVQKGVMLSHSNIVANTQSICDYLKLTEDDIQMIVLPFFYVMGKSLLNTHFAVGGTVIINNRFLYPADVVRQMIDEKVTGFSGVPSTYAYLLNRSPLASSRDELHHLRYCSQAGGHMAKSVKLALRKALPKKTEIFIMYGATEASARLTYLDPENFIEKINSIGKPIPGVTIHILDETGNVTTSEKEGELVAKGPNIMMGYWKDPTYTASVLDAQGYHTGDIGYRDKEGFLFVSRRKDGLIKVGGHRINPTEIEDYLLSTDMLIEAAISGVPDKLLGNKLIALVVPKGEIFDADSLLERCATELPKHKMPAEIIPVRLLPKNASGKIDKQKCKELIFRMNQ